MPTRSLALPLGEPGDAMSSSSDLTLEREFELVQRLDASRRGECWLAVRRMDGCRVLLTTIAADALSEEDVDLLRQNWRTFAGLPSHPQVAPAFATGGELPHLYLATVLAEGEDLCTLVANTGPLPIDAAAACLLQALHGLKHLHDHGLAHGDLHPSDLTLDWDGELKIQRLGWGAFEDCCDELPPVARDLRGLSGVLHLLLLGHNAPRCACGGRQTNVAPAALNHLPETSLSQASRSLPPALDDFYARLRSAGTARGFSSAAEALSALEQLRPILEDAAAHESAAWLESDTAPLVERSHAGDAVPPECATSAMDWGVSRPPSALGESRPAEPLTASAPPSTRDGSTNSALPAKRPAVNRTGVLLVGSVALALAALLAMAGYLWSL